MSPGLAYITTNRVLINFTRFITFITEIFHRYYVSDCVTIYTSAFQTFCVSDTLLNQKQIGGGLFLDFMKIWLNEFRCKMQ